VLRVHLQKAAGLKASDPLVLGGKADPYVIACLGRAEKRTRVVTSTLAPVWNEWVEFEHVSLDDVLKHGLLLKVLDRDRIGHDDDLGTVSVSLEALRVSDEASYQEELTTQGSLVFSVTWTPLRVEEGQSGTLFVRLAKATGLKAMDSNGFSDPYAKLSLCGTVHKSKTIKKTLDPVWDQTFSFKGVLRTLFSEPLQLHVWDYDTFSRDDKLGHAAVELRDLELAGRGLHELSVRLSEQGVVDLHVWWVPDGATSNLPVPQAARGGGGIGGRSGRVPVPAHVRTTFNHFDDNASGFLDYKELRSALRHYGFAASEYEAAAVVRRYDDSPDGKLDLPEFAALVRDLEAGTLRQDEARGTLPRTPAGRMGGVRDMM